MNDECSDANGRPKRDGLFNYQIKPEQDYSVVGTSFTASFVPSSFFLP